MRRNVVVLAPMPLEMQAITTGFGLKAVRGCLALDG
jgi:hypothetical protein